ncbi:formate dehydrogenase accessory sulfurtransferase FdhD [Sporohalobacter salinus]|uniref:formate dehydrogenase accessory sulfurtransferase FdhD n=1 Tax=Sporohalobacter salinus TaxID=1494606 RepID=UPI00195FDF08|nr:formate dehydrogenase accessory sulfurtransferase FdhD [Sporohalobacter salinus]MBM7624356.1 FdhD protein [Sporohalobacter salinus]
MVKSKEVSIIRVSKDGNNKVTDSVVVELPLTIILNGEEVVTMLCTPEKIDYLAVGFLKSEGLITDHNDIRNVEINEEDGIVEVITEEEISSLVKKLYDTRTITSGCGKGTVFYNVIDSMQCSQIGTELEISIDQTLKLVKKLQKKANLFQKTGGSHSSALCNLEEVMIFSEDIGRHNAVDKIVGEAIMKGLSLDDKLLVTSGRVSSEILLKTAKLGLPILISRSAPTSLAVKMAEELNLTLICFARRNRMNIYTHDWRIKT